MPLNRNLRAAKRNKNDDFYTQLPDIENELRHYKPDFKDKTVLCNCDDPRVSNFFRYFSQNFKHLGLRKLVTTCYKNQNPDLFSQHDVERAIMLEYDGFRDDEHMPRPEDIGIEQMDGDGDFRSQECIDILKQADIVVTNPPFSLFREYVTQLIEHDKKFLIIGNQNAITYKEIFPRIMEGRLWLGYGFRRNCAHFISNYADHATDMDKKEGMIRVSGVVWFTNLDHNKRHEQMLLYRPYTPEDYPKYDNYDAIEVRKTTDIPMNYDGAMGVPITFLTKYNPDQFEILGMDHDVKAGLLPNIINPQWKGKTDRGYINGKRQYSRILIRNRNPRP